MNCMKYLCLSFLMDFLLTFPILLTIYILFFEFITLHNLLIMIAISYIIGILARTLFKKKKRILSILIVFLYSIASIHFIIFNYTSAGFLAVLLIGILAFISGIRGIMIGEHNNTDTIFPSFYYLISIFIYFIAFFFYGKITACKEYKSYILISGLITVVVSLFMVNSKVLKGATDSELKRSSNIPLIKRNNHIIISITVIIITFIASYNVIKEYFLHVLKATILFLLKLIDRIMNYFNTPTEGEPLPPANQPQGLLPAEEADVALWVRVLETIFYVIAIVILLILVFIAIRFAIKLIIKLYRKLRDFLKRFFKGSYIDDEYFVVDEKESLLDLKSLGKNYVDNFKKWWGNVLKKETKWYELTDNKQRIRYLYKQIILKNMSQGFSFKKSNTSDETIDGLLQDERLDKDSAQSLKDLYKKARYGNINIDDADVKNLKEKLYI